MRDIPGESSAISEYITQTFAGINRSELLRTNRSLFLIADKRMEVKSPATGGPSTFVAKGE